MEAKGEADAMQFTLPLKEKQIEQSRLEAQARKEATMNPEAEGEAKIMDGQAEFQRRNLLAEAEANRIRVTAVADAERMQGEARLLNQAPLLINKIIAERLSDKIQVMMVPGDGKFFFANDVFKGFGANAGGQGRHRLAGRRQPAGIRTERWRPASPYGRAGLQMRAQMQVRMPVAGYNPRQPMISHRRPLLLVFALVLLVPACASISWDNPADELAKQIAAIAGPGPAKPPSRIVLPFPQIRFRRFDGHWSATCSPTASLHRETQRLQQ